MAFVINGETKYTPTLRLVRPYYPEQRIAESHNRMEHAARLWWDKLRTSGDYEQAVNAARGWLTHDELTSHEFSHILYKRRPLDAVY